MTAHRASGWHRLALGVLLLVLVLQAFPTISLKSPAFDEPAHIGAGFSYLKTGEFKVNLQHPPLLKEIAALPLVLFGASWPMSERDWSMMTDDPEPSFQWRLGDKVIYENDHERVMFWSRLPFLGLTLLLGFLLYEWGRRLLGGTAALAALFLYALDPTIVAHGTLVTTDVGFAALVFLFLYALWHYLNHRSSKRLLWCCLALGAALASKFTAVLLLPIAGMLIFWATRWIPAAVPRRASTLIDPYASADGGQRIVWCLYTLLAMSALAALVVYALYFFPSNPFLYLEGLRRINADHDPTHLVYMAGHFRRHFWSYYLVAFLLKEPIPSLLLGAFGLWALLRRGSVPSMERAFILLPPSVLFLVYTVMSHNLGFRYMIPVLPFLYLAGGFAVSELLRNGRAWGRAIVAVSFIWMALTAGAVFPDHLSYFNETACLLPTSTRTPDYSVPGRIGLDGGTECGPLWLDDSNVDWGQGLKQLKAWADENAPGRQIRLGYFGTARVWAYGLNFERIRGIDLISRPPPGLYAVSTHLVARTLGELTIRYGRARENWILHTPPVAVVGGAFYVYDLSWSP